MKIITRKQWGARPFRTPPTRVPLSSRRYFVVHYPGAGTPPKDVMAYAKWIERIHMDQNGWRACGYNYFISHGKIAEGCGRDVIGSHSPPRNRDGIGVNIWTSNGRPRDEDLQLARELYDQLCRQAGRKLIMSYHGKDYPTECPGPALREWVRDGMPVAKSPAGASGEKPAEKPKPWDEMNVSVSKINWALGGYGRYSHSMKRLQEAAATFPKIVASAGMVADGTRGTWNFDKDKSRMQDVIDQIRDYAYVERAPKGKAWPEKDRRGSIGPTSLRWILNAADFDNPVVD